MLRPSMPGPTTFSTATSSALLNATAFTRILPGLSKCPRRLPRRGAAYRRGDRFLPAQRISRNGTTRSCRARPQDGQRIQGDDGERIQGRLPITPQRPVAVPATPCHEQPPALCQDRPAVPRHQRPAAPCHGQPAARRQDRPGQRWRRHRRLLPEGVSQAADPGSFQHLGHHPIGAQWLARRSCALASWSSSWRGRLGGEWPPAIYLHSRITGSARCACHLRAKLCPAVSVPKHGPVGRYDPLTDGLTLMQARRIRTRTRLQSPALRQDQLGFSDSRARPIAEMQP